MRWVANLAPTMSGLLGKRLDIAEEGGWEIPLNGIESFDLSLSKREASEIDPSWWKPYKTSVVVSIEHEGKLTPWIAGPIVSPPVESQDLISLECKGIGAILEKRVLLAREYARDPNLLSEMIWLAKSVFSRKGHSYGTIAQDIVKFSTEAKLGGQLPIRYASPRESGSRLRERNYRGYNLSNNGTWKRLTELSNVINGPDIAFRPEFDEFNRFVWAMYHGTHAQPTIAQDWTMTLDLTAENSPMASVTVTQDASNLCSRVYWTGAGEGAGTLIRVVQDESLLADHTPLLEVVGSTSDTENAQLVTDHAMARLESGRNPITQLSGSINAALPQCLIGRWHVGDSARIKIGSDWLTIPSGTRDYRIISAKGSWVDFKVDLEFQPDGFIYEPEASNGEED